MKAEGDRASHSESDAAVPDGVIALPYFEDPTLVLKALAPFGDPALLDSGGSERGRWDIIGACPDPSRRLHLSSELSIAEVRCDLDRFQTLAARLCPASDLSPDTASAAQPHADRQPPFTGGYIGYFSYELGRRLLGFIPRPILTPLASVQYYPWAVVQDRRRKQSRLVGHFDLAVVKAVRQRLDAVGRVDRELDPGAAFALRKAFAPAWSSSQFADVFARVSDYIRAGDCYQINIGQPFRAPFEGDLLAAYGALRDVAAAPYSAYLPGTPAGTLLSLSPERFLTVRNGQVETRPIKGTRPRGETVAADRSSARELLASEKERAENLMIVDLLRNDIGRFCRPGSVHVDALFALESYATVHHLVSSVRGTLAPGVTPLQLLLGCLPGGSITGAPKRRAMEIIDELEPASRQSWCGSVFYLSRNGCLDSNIAIRTLFNEGEDLLCWAGGGLVADSRPEAEYAEQYDKVGAFLARLAEGRISIPAAQVP